MVRHLWTWSIALALPLATLPTQDPLVDFQGPLVAIDDDLNQVRGGAILSDGRIVIANSGNRELRLYSREGALMRKIGRPGEGPGEFRAVTDMIVDASDSIFVLDWQLRRISVFAPTGEYARVLSTTHLSTGLAQPQLIGFLGRDQLLVGLRATADPAAKPGIQRPKATYLLINREGHVVDTVAVVPGAERWVRPGNQALLTAPLPFGRTTSAAVTSSVVVFADQATADIRVLDSRGGVLKSIKSPWAPQSLRRSDIENYKNWRLAHVPEVARAGEERTLAEIPMPTIRPGFGRVHAARSGALLLERFRGYPAEPGEAVVLAPGGRNIARLRIPSAFEILWFGDDVVLALTRDELDVETVGTYRIPLNQ